MGNGYYKGMNYKDTTYYEGKYYTFPIEILRCLMDEPKERLRDVLCHHSALLAKTAGSVLKSGKMKFFALSSNQSA